MKSIYLLQMAGRRVRNDREREEKQEKRIKRERRDEEKEREGDEERRREGGEEEVREKLTTAPRQSTSKFCIPEPQGHVLQKMASQNLPCLLQDSCQ